MTSKKNLPQANKFIVKLVAMMQDFPSIINWSEDGMELEIYNVQLFINDVHPLYFASSNYKSFLRQLNMYSFSKMSKRKNSINFRHPAFSKGQETLFCNIRRRKQNAKDSKPNPNIFSEFQLGNKKLPSSQPENIQAALSSEIKQLLKQIKSALKGNGNGSFAKLLNNVAKLQDLTKEGQPEALSKKESEMSKEFLSMHKIQRLAGSNKQIFTEQDLEYNMQQSIFNSNQN